MRYLTQNENWGLNKEYNISVILYLLIDRPNRITGRKPESFIWYNNQYQWHRNYGLPAVTSIDFVEWYINDKSAGTLFNFN